MTRLSPVAVLFLFGFIGIITHKLGLWLPFGIIAMIAVAGAQRTRALAATDGNENFRRLSDAELLATYERTKSEPDDPAAVALLAEIRRRGLDV